MCGKFHACNRQRKRQFLENSLHVKIECEQVCVERRTSADDEALPEFAAAAPAVQQSIDIC